MYPETIDELEQRIYEHDNFLPLITKEVGYGYDSFHIPYGKCTCGESIFLKTREIEIKMSLSDEKIEDVEEFKEIFCKEAKLIVNLTDEEIVIRRHRLENIVRNFRTRISKDNDEIAHRKGTKNKTEREALEKFDRDYKVKPEIVEVKEKKKSPYEKATGKSPSSKEERAISQVMEQMSWDYEQAKKFVKGS